MFHPHRKQEQLSKGFKRNDENLRQFRVELIDRRIEQKMNVLNVSPAVFFPDARLKKIPPLGGKMTFRKTFL